MVVRLCVCGRLRSECSKDTSEIHIKDLYPCKFYINVTSLIMPLHHYLMDVCFMTHKTDRQIIKFFVKELDVLMNLYRMDTPYC